MKKPKWPFGGGNSEIGGEKQAFVWILGRKYQNDPAE
jgi:hypothetical protein